MPYVVNNTRGQVIAVVQDGTINTSATSQTLVGKNVTPYGEYEVENLVHQLENFADDTPPINPIEGQLWWDIGTDTLNAYSGDAWKRIDAVTVSPIAPTGIINPGDLWFNSNSLVLQIYAQTNAGLQWIPVYVIPIQSTAPATAVPGSLYYNSSSQQLYLYDSTNNWSLVGPENVPNFATTRWQSTSLLDVNSNPRPVIIGYVNGQAQAIVSYLEFSIRADQRPAGFDDLVPGINLSATAVLKGRATQSDKLTTARTINGVPFDGTANINIPTLGVTSIGIINGGGIEVGNSPVTGEGNITITNTGVTRLSAGSGLRVTANTGDIGIVNTGIIEILGGTNIQVVRNGGTVTLDASGATGPQGPAGAKGDKGDKGDPGSSGDRYKTTSSSFLELGSGTRGLAVDLGLSYTAGQSVVIAHDGNNYFEATVTSYNSGSGFMNVNIVNFKGSGSYQSWVVNLGGATGPAGPQGNTGSAGPQGPAGPAGDRYNTTSTTTLSTSTGTKNLFVGIGLSYTAAQYVVVSESSDRYMEGRVISYNSASGLLSVNVTNAVGSGSSNNWTVNLAGIPGPAGPAGPTGPQGPEGPQGSVAQLIAGDNIRLSPENGIGTVTISSTGAGGAYAGQIAMWAGTTPPNKWVLCDGRAISRSSYSTLFSRIGTTYGAGNGSTTFNIPDMRGRLGLGAYTGLFEPGTTGTLALQSYPLMDWTNPDNLVLETAINGDYGSFAEITLDVYSKFGGPTWPGVSGGTSPAVLAAPTNGEVYVAVFGYPKARPTSNNYVRTVTMTQMVDLTGVTTLTYQVNRGTNDTWGEVLDSGEVIKLQYSLYDGGHTGSTSSWVDLDVPPTNLAGNTWTTRTVTLPSAITNNPTHVKFRFLQTGAYSSSVSTPYRDTWAVTSLKANGSLSSATLASNRLMGNLGGNLGGRLPVEYIGAYWIICLEDGGGTTGGDSGPVTRIIAGDGVTISPSTGLGDVTITASGGGSVAGRSLQANGWADLGGNLLVQWGTVGASYNQKSITVTYPKAFSGTPWNVQATVKSGTVIDGVYTPFVHSVTQSGFQILGETDSGKNFKTDVPTYWMAIGPTNTGAGGQTGGSGSINFEGSLTQPGWTKMPNGLIQQWGTGTTGSNGRVTILYPVAFEEACFSVQIVERNAQGWGPATSTNSEPTIYGTYEPPGRTSMIVQGVRVKGTGKAPGESGLSFSWFAVGK